MASLDPITAALVRVLATQPGLTAREIARALGSSGFAGIDKRTINRWLYGNRSMFVHTDETPPHWSLTGAVQAPPPPIPATTVHAPPAVVVPAGWLGSLDLYPWQERALDGWAKAGHRGVIEAVTGAGKTRLALAAIGTELARKGKAVTIVPTTNLQQQWVEEIEHHLIRGAGFRVRVGLLGQGYGSSLASCDILIATVQSACQWFLQPPATGALLIADEVHHYGAEVWSQALKPGFDRRLGLTATYQRDDSGVATVLDPYFGRYRYELGYREALDDDVIAHFKIAFIGVRFAASELVEYRKLDDAARTKRWNLIMTYGLAEEPFGLFMQQVSALAKADGPAARQAGLYLSAFSKRRRLLAGAGAKFEMIRTLTPAIEAADRTILFSQTVEAAQKAVEVIEEEGLSGDVLHALLDPSERKDTFDAFREGDYHLIAAPKLLDEGINVPDSDLAIVLASSRSRRQMIQRMGRVIRKKADGRLARVAVLYVEDTSEDPSHGAHEDFIGFVTDAADDYQIFGGATDIGAVVDYLNDW